MTSDEKARFEKTLNRADLFEIDVWAETLNAANVERDSRDVPVTGQRHLIDVWASVRTGIQIFTNRMKARIVALMNECKEKQDTIDELRAIITRVQEENHDLAIQFAKADVNQILDGQCSDLTVSRVVERIEDARKSA
jgi:hypothetical protein